MVLTVPMEVHPAHLWVEVFPWVHLPTLGTPYLTKVQYLVAIVVLVQPTPQPPAQFTPALVQELPVQVPMVLQLYPALHTLDMVAGTLHLTQVWEDLAAT